MRADVFVHGDQDLDDFASNVTYHVVTEPSYEGIMWREVCANDESAADDQTVAWVCTDDLRPQIFARYWLLKKRREENVALNLSFRLQ